MTYPILVATSFNGFHYNDDERLGVGRSLRFTDEKGWLEIPGHGRYDDLPKEVILVDVAASMNILPVLAEDLDFIQGIELVLIHEFVHAFSDSSYPKNHTEVWNDVLVPLIREYVKTESQVKEGPR